MALSSSTRRCSALAKSAFERGLVFNEHAGFGEPAAKEAGDHFLEQAFAAIYRTGQGEDLALVIGIGQ